MKLLPIQKIWRQSSRALIRILGLECMKNRSLWMNSLAHVGILLPRQHKTSSTSTTFSCRYHRSICYKMEILRHLYYFHFLTTLQLLPPSRRHPNWVPQTYHNPMMIILNYLVMNLWKWVRQFGFLQLTQVPIITWLIRCDYEFIEFTRLLLLIA